MPLSNNDEAILPPEVVATSPPNTLHNTCPPETPRPFVSLEPNDVFERVVSASIIPSNGRRESQSIPHATSASPNPSDSSTSIAISGDRRRDDAQIDTTTSSTLTNSPLPDVTAFKIPTSPFASTTFPPLLRSLDSSSPKPVPQYTSSFLRHGSKFTGTQQSDRQMYKVEVEIKHIDMSESFICGFLKIEGLTKDHPTLTTYFEGEIIGSKHTFQTRHAEWGSNEKVDMQHWNRFPEWRPLAKQARRTDFSYKNFAERESIFMRWKEYFLVPDHRVRTISGASFEGFYYICFNQVRGDVSGIYFHSKSEKYQRLELKHVPDRGCLGAMEFR